MEVVVLGSCSIDLFVRAARLPKTGETVIGTSFAKAFGGKGANQAVQAALLGSAVSFVGRVGNTSEGREIVANFQRMGVDCHAVSAVDECAAGVALIEVDEASGDNRIVVVPGANALVASRDLHDDVLRRCAFLVMQLEIPLDVTLDALRRAAASNVRTVLNPSPVPGNAQAMQQLRGALRDVAYLILNGEREREHEELQHRSGVAPVTDLSKACCVAEYEAEQIASVRVSDVASASAACRALLDFGVGCVVLTLGSQGAVYQDRGSTTAAHVSAPHVERVVDTTGAGDSFLGAMVHYLHERVALPDAVARSVKVASLRCAARDGISCARVSRARHVRSRCGSVLKPGCQPSYSNRAQVKDAYGF